MKTPDISVLEAALGHRFQRRELLQQALTHSSHARERESQKARADASPVPDNEQLEFLGDSVLALVTAEELFRRFPHFREGELSKARAYLVSEKHLIRAARELELGRYLVLGKGEEKGGGRNKPALLVDCLEAVLAAIYLDAGLTEARAFAVRAILEPEVERLGRKAEDGLLITDYKSALQEQVQSLVGYKASYVVVKEEGPEHKKVFTVEAQIHSRGRSKPEYVGHAQGSTKKTAEQDAARQLLTYLASRPKESDGKTARSPQAVDQ